MTTALLISSTEEFLILAILLWIVMSTLDEGFAAIPSIRLAFRKIMILESFWETTKLLINESHAKEISFNMTGVLQVKKLPDG